MTQVKSSVLGQGFFGRAFFRFARDLAMVVCTLYFRMSCNGREHVPRNGAYVLAAVHRSNVDIVVVGAVTRRRQRYMGKDSLWKKQPFSWILTALGGFPVTRGTVDRQALQRCIDVLEAGEPLVLYPEGTRLSGPVVGELFDGAMYVASKVGVPVVPVGIAGTERAMAKGSKGIRPAKVHLEIGPPIMPPVAIDGRRVSREALGESTAKLRTELQRLFDLAQRRTGA